MVATQSGGLPLSVKLGWALYSAFQNVVAQNPTHYKFMKQFMYKASYWSILLAMKLTLIFVLIGTLQVGAHAPGFAQSVSYSGKNVRMTAVFHAVEEQTGYGVIMEKSLLEASKPVTVEVRNASLEEVFRACFANQPWKLKYTISGKTVIVSKAELAAPSVDEVVATPLGMSGRILGENGSPLDGATVEIPELKMRGVTNEKGDFLIKYVPNGKYKVQVTYVGYDRFVTEVKVINEEAFLIANMQKANTKLDQVQVIAYGTTTRRYSTGDVSTVSGEELTKQPVSNPLLGLQGRVPGLLVTQSAGAPNSNVKVQVLGPNSIQNGNDPLYVIDGVPYTSQTIPGVNTNITGGPTSPFSFLNPTDIENISVLKDADATSIYGSRAANGAILITTKRGKQGATKLDFNFQQGIGQDTRRLMLLNTKQYLAMRHEAITNDGSTVGPADYDLNGTYDTTSYTDWQKKLIGGTAEYTTASASVSGGNANTQFLVGATYHRETTVYPGRFANQKGTLHFSIDNVSSNQKFKLQLIGSYLFDKTNLPYHDLTYDAINLSPDAPQLYNKDGSLNWAPNVNGNSTFYNPMAYLTANGESTNGNLIGNALISYKIISGLELKLSAGYTNLQTDETSIAPSISKAPEFRASYIRSSFFGNTNINSWILEPQLTYKKSIGEGKLEALIGESIQRKNSRGQQLNAIGFSADEQMYDIAAAATVYPSEIPSLIYKYNAFFGRVNFVWQDKYILDASARRDGSSRFGSANQFHNFGAISAGWIFSNESIFKNASSIFSFGKLTASYGTTGNDQIGDYTYLSLFGPVTVPTPYQGATGVVPTGLSNPYLEWEETKKIKGGMDLGFFKDHLLIGVTYFRSRSSNQLLPYSLPTVTGFGAISSNFPATVQNSGFEITISSTNIKTKDFSWFTHANLTIPQNKLVSFKNIDNSTYSNQLIVGKPISIVKAFHILGANDTTGVYQFADSKGNPTYNPVTGVDDNVIINTAPKFYGGFQNTFEFKGFQLDVLFQFVKQIARSYYYGSYPGTFSSAYNGAIGNQPTTVLNAWHKLGDKSDVQRYNSDFSLFSSVLKATRASDGAYRDASYIRLKNISVSWFLPSNLLKKISVQQVRVYLQAQNVLTFTKYKGLDPETANSFVLPPLRVITAGLAFSL